MDKKTGFSPSASQPKKKEKPAAVAQDNQPKPIESATKDVIEVPKDESFKSDVSIESVGGIDSDGDSSIDMIGVQDPLFPNPAMNTTKSKSA